MSETPDGPIASFDVDSEDEDQHAEVENENEHESEREHENENESENANENGEDGEQEQEETNATAKAKPSKGGVRFKIRFDDEASEKAAEEAGSSPVESSDDALANGNTAANANENEHANANENENENANENAEPQVRFRVVLDDEEEKVAAAALEQELSLKDLLAGYSVDTLPADAPKFLRVLIHQKDAHAAIIEQEIAKVRRRAAKFGLPEPTEAVAKLQDEVFEFDVAHLPGGAQLSLSEMWRLIRVFNTKRRLKAARAAREAAGAANDGDGAPAAVDAELEAEEKRQQAEAEEEAKVQAALSKSHERFERFGLEGLHRSLAIRWLPNARFVEDAEVRPSAVFVRPAVKLIPANTPDIVHFFKRFRPAWVEWLGGTFIVELEDASCVESLFKELTVKVPLQLSTVDPATGSEDVSISDKPDWRLCLKPVVNTTSKRFVNQTGAKTWLFVRRANTGDKKKTRIHPTVGAAIHAMTHWNSVGGEPRRNNRGGNARGGRGPRYQQQSHQRDFNVRVKRKQDAVSNSNQSGASHNDAPTPAHANNTDSENTLLEKKRRRGRNSSDGESDDE